ncbi:MAG: DUF2889 domain-containing protein [Deltaproteobacteria bacterium]|nr:DUF2889 domain-containing protein [Deltaproteobacteria bacterium]
MPSLLGFSRNRCTCVEQLDGQTMRSWCRLQDTLTDAFVEIIVRLPDLEITGARGEVLRSHQEECLKPAGSLEKMVGVRIGPGMLEIIKGLMGKTEVCSQLTFMVEECCHSVILSLTKDVLSAAPTDKEGAKDFFRDMVKGNARLYNRCAAFAPGSPLVEGIENLQSQEETC